jgi:hypothetical protein
MTDAHEPSPVRCTTPVCARAGTGKPVRGLTAGARA